jgi:hypothetical protein
MEPIAPVMRVRRPQSAIAPSADTRANLARRLAEIRLQEVDAAVRAHEHAHVNALGKGVIVYDTLIGPDGTAYAVGGSVAVDLSPVPGDPEATIRKARIAIQAWYA